MQKNNQNQTILLFYPFQPQVSNRCPKPTAGTSFTSLRDHKKAYCEPGIYIRNRWETIAVSPECSNFLLVYFDFLKSALNLTLQLVKFSAILNLQAFLRIPQMSHTYSKDKDSEGNRL